MENRVVADEDARARAGFHARLPRSALQADAIVPHIHGTAGHQHVLRIHEVYSVPVLRVPRAPDRHPVDDDLLTTLRNQVELGRILQGNPLNQHAFAICKPHQVGTQALLLPIGGRDVREMRQVKRIPQAPLLRDRAAHAQVILPFRIAHLSPLDRPPPFAVSVNDALAGDAYIFPLAGGDARNHLPVLEEGFLFGREQDDRSAVQMQVDPAFQADGAGEPDARRDVQVPAPLLLEGGNGLPERFRIQADAIRTSAEIQQGYARNGDLRDLRLGQVLIQVRIIARLHPSAQEAGHQQGYSVFFHLVFVLML